jgi:hypothetical protein
MMLEGGGRVGEEAAKEEEGRRTKRGWWHASLSLCVCMCVKEKSGKENEA